MNVNDALACSSILDKLVIDDGNVLLVFPLNRRQFCRDFVGTADDLSFFVTSRPDRDRSDFAQLEKVVLCDGRCISGAVSTHH